MSFERIIAALFDFAFYYPLFMSYLWMTGAIYYFFYREHVEKRPVDDPPRLPDTPGVSFIVPCHNEARNVRDTICALLEQDYPDFEVIAVNDASTDDTGEILEAMAEDSDRLRVIHLATNQGKAMGLRVAAIACFVQKRIELALGVVPASHVLDDYYVAIACQFRLVDVLFHVLVVRSTEQQDRKPARRFGPVNIGGEVHPITHRDQNVVFDLYLVLTRGRKPWRKHERMHLPKVDPCHPYLGSLIAAPKRDGHVTAPGPLTSHLAPHEAYLRFISSRRALPFVDAEDNKLSGMWASATTPQQFITGRGHSPYRRPILRKDIRPSAPP